jgi:acyl-CoA dehydrogenase
MAGGDDIVPGGLDPELTELAADVFAAAAPDDGDGSMDMPLWRALERTGLARLTLPAAHGGGDGTLLDLAAVLIEAGAAAARVPLVETALTGGWLAAAAGLEVPAGSLAVATGELDTRRSGDGRRVSGTLPRVGWAREASAVVVLNGPEVLCLDPGAATVQHGANLAGEPRDTVVLDDLAVPAASVAAAPPRAAEHLRLRAALGRALLLAGAARNALGAGVRYAGERVQFGRPIGRFQAVQQQLALTSGEVAAASTAAVSAAACAASRGFDVDATVLAVAAAKARTSESAGSVARMVHQVHGAMGFTLEHSLRHATTRLWAWRDEDGSEAAWQLEIGSRVLAAGGDGLWPALVG